MKLHTRRGFFSKMGNILDEKRSRSPQFSAPCSFLNKKNCFQFVHYSIFAYSISKEFSFITFFFLIYSEIRLITKLVLASFRPENRQKIDLIHLCFGESGRFFENIENRPD